MRSAPVMIPMVRPRKHALSLLLLSLSAPVLLSPRAHAQEDVPTAQPELPPADDAGTPEPIVDEDQDAPQAPPLVVQLPLPSSQSQEPTSEPKPAVETAAKPKKKKGASQAADQEADAAEPEHGSIPGDPFGDAQGPSMVTLRALMQLRYTSTFAAESNHALISGREKEEILAQEGDGWNMHKLFVRLASDPSKYLGFRTVLDFADLARGNFESSLKQAYATLRPIPGRLEVNAGLFKLPFSVLELDPSSRYEFASFGPSNRLVSDLGFAGRDLGLQLMAAPFKKAKRLRLYFGAFRGHAKDEHDSPAGSLAARAETKPTKWLRLGADWVEHLQALTYNRPFNTSSKDVLPNPPDPQYPTQRNWGKGRAFSVDARIKKKGFNLRGEFIMGDRVDLDERHGARSFWAAWGLLAYRLETSRVTFIPAVRAEWFDADREHRAGLWRTISGSASALFLERARFMIDVTHVDVRKNTPILDQPKPLQAPPFMALDQLRVTAQLQLEI